ncbi:amino acid permease [Saccharopolyspora shandongensis]|uniref:amino acid permease n=1 Tax=Saccharopolyspora shandongensis TaxID=418495 RepID=UPI00340CCE97
MPFAALVMNFVVLTAALSSANTNLYLCTRMLHSLAGHGYAPHWTAKLSKGGVPRNALLLSAAGLLVATALSAAQGNAAYLVLFGLSIFGALAVWILILVTHLAFRRTRAAAGLPLPKVRLRGAPVTAIAAILFLAAILVSTAFIDDLAVAWWAGVPFFIVLSAIYFAVGRKSRGGLRHAPIADESSA